MTKRQLIDEITSINRTAQPGFLARFDEMDLDEYLRHLRHARTKRLGGDAAQYSKYFAASAPAGAGTKEPLVVPLRPKPVLVGSPAESDSPPRAPAATGTFDATPAPPFLRQMSGALPPPHRTLPAAAPLAAGSAIASSPSGLF